jgi:transglutaminase-like putative cysteine protease
MGIKVALEQRTGYTFDRLVEVHPHVIRLRPAPHSRTPIEAYSLTVEPDDHFVNWQRGTPSAISLPAWCSRPAPGSSRSPSA